MVQSAFNHRFACLQLVPQFRFKTSQDAKLKYAKNLVSQTELYYSPPQSLTSLFTLALVPGPSSLPFLQGSCKNHLTGSLTLPIYCSPAARVNFLKPKLDHSLCLCFTSARSFPLPIQVNSKFLSTVYEVLHNLAPDYLFHQPPFSLLLKFHSHLAGCRSLNRPLSYLRLECFSLRLNN